MSGLKNSRNENGSGSGSGGGRRRRYHNKDGTTIKKPSKKNSSGQGNNGNDGNNESHQPLVASHRPTDTTTLAPTPKTLAPEVNLNMIAK